MKNNKAVPEIQCPDKRKDGRCILNNQPCIRDSGITCVFYEEYLAEVNGELLRE